MRKVSVQWLMDNAIFNDLHDGETKWEMFSDKLDYISWTFVASVEANGIQAGVVYEFDTNIFYNGHHRLLVAYILGIEEIAVFDSDVDDFESSDFACNDNGWPSAKTEE